MVVIIEVGLHSSILVGYITIAPSPVGSKEGNNFTRTEIVHKIHIHIIIN